MIALGACSGRAERWDERAEPADEPSGGTVDSFAAPGSTIGGSDGNVLGAAAGAAGSLTTAPEPEADPQLAHGAEAAGTL
jgi:hypothetical protein